jgi:hypothetical protein
VYPHGQRGAECRVELAASGEQLVEQRGADVAVGAPGGAVAGIVVGLSGAQVEQTALGGCFAQAPFHGGQVAVGEQAHGLTLSARRPPKSADVVEASA